MKYEIESKYILKDKSLLNNFLKDAKSLREGTQKDIYYDTSDAMFFQKAVFIRVRDDRLDFKFKKDFKKGDKHDGCSETSFDIPFDKNKLDTINNTLEYLGLNSIPDADFDLFLQVNNLQQFVIIDKRFYEYQLEGFKFRLDEVKDLGSFLEIEKITYNENEVKVIKSKILQYEKKLNLEFVNTGYVELYLRENDFDLYLRGPYLLDKDKN